MGLNTITLNCMKDYSLKLVAIDVTHASHGKLCLIMFESLLYCETQSLLFWNEFYP